MSQIFAAEGGYQIFTLGGQEWFWLIFAAAVAVLALLVGLGDDARRAGQGRRHGEDG